MAEPTRSSRSAAASSTAAAAAALGQRASPREAARRARGAAETASAGPQGRTGAGGLDLVGAWIRRHADWLIAAGVLGLLVTLVTPLPPLALDALLTLSIGLSILLLLVTLNVRRGLELSTFPTILLFTTLFRLGLNVASTRLILTEGEAGTIITAFGRYVVGDNLTVGLIVFLILVVIQFVVITKGAGRISEVAARFVLDAMPGKQMAIDADLNAGSIDSDEARRRRVAIVSEAEFYGAMDGASKFVRGDAVAGLIITALNLVGGIAIATARGMSLDEAAERYSMLSVGDGLVSQIPALLVSTAAAVLVTKASSAESLGPALVGQVARQPRATLVAGALLGIVGLLPGMPATPFLILASVLCLLSRVRATGEAPEPPESDDAPDAARRAGAARAASASGTSGGPGTPGAAGTLGAGGRGAGEASAEELLYVDRVALEIGFRLIPLVQDKSGTGILEHVAQLRRRFAVQLGVLLPPVRIKDNIRLEPDAYRVLVGGHEIARGTVEPGALMAMDGGGVTGKIAGREARDPTFGLPAWWIRESQRDEAELAGYTVVDPTSVLVTHLSETLRGALPEILSRDDVKELVEGARKECPAVVQELVPDKLGYGDVHRVLRALLREGVPVRNMPAILEGLADHAGKTKDAEALCELVRQRIARALVEQHADRGGVVHAVTLDPAIEARLAAAVGSQQDPDAQPVSPAWLQALMERVADSLAQATRGGRDAVVLVRSNVRRFVNELVRASLPKVSVLSYSEVVNARAVETAAIVRLEDVR
jgi:flagellar biosynthesis protein FlhA